MSNIISKLGRGLEALGTFGGSELRRAQALERQRIEREQRQELGRVLSGQSIPAFARPGGAEPLPPEQFRQTQLQQLSALATPKSTELLAKISPLTEKALSSVAVPSAVKEFKFVQKLTPEQRQLFFETKRTDPLRAKGLVESPEGEVTIKPGFATSMKDIVKQQQTGRLQARLELEPTVVSAINAAKILGTQKGTKRAELAERLAGFPQLQKVTVELSALGKIATFTKAGQARDAFLRQTNQELGAGGIARAKYIAKIDNEILPLLKQTFGSQFTQTEGESLKATLGDINKSSAEKDAILEAFLDAKIGQIETLQREIGALEAIPTGQSILPQQGEGTIATNPQTGQKLILRGGQWVPL